MSHTLEFETTITNQEALIRALKRMGVPEHLIEVHETAQRLKTYHSEEYKKAHVIVRRDIDRFLSGAHSDIGWERNEDGVFVGHIDEYDYRIGMVCDKEWQQKLYTYCNVETLKMEYERQGMEYTESLDAQKRIVLRAKFKAPVTVNRIKTHTK